MSEATGAAAAVQQALVAAIEAAGGGPVIDGGTPAALPALTVGETGSTDWGLKGAQGREVRLAVTCWDEPDGTARIHARMATVERAFEALSGTLAGGWEVGSVALVRTRVLRPGDGPWAGMVDYRVRVARQEEE